MAAVGQFDSSAWQRIVGYSVESSVEMCSDLVLSAQLRLELLSPTDGPKIAKRGFQNLGRDFLRFVLTIGSTAAILPDRWRRDDRRFCI